MILPTATSTLFDWFGFIDKNISGAPREVADIPPTYVLCNDSTYSIRSAGKLVGCPAAFSCPYEHPITTTYCRKKWTEGKSDGLALPEYLDKSMPAWPPGPGQPRAASLPTSSSQSRLSSVKVPI